MCICHDFIDSIIRGINIQHSMLDFHKENTVSKNKKCHIIFRMFTSEYLVNIYSFGAWCIYGLYRQPRI